ncbi:MAG TPA: acyltransferase [Hyphomonas sp.]|nr:acyltransferase [Hyphomonas sp.]HRK67863.1 acyltransferase [Hyphomonas sp.]
MKLQSVQALRGLAALLVVFYHIRALETLSIAANGLEEVTWVSRVFSNGYAGVDLFFVISGFIMVFVTRSGQTGLQPAADFLFARATRIYPIWWAFAGMMTIYMAAAHGLPNGTDGWQTVSRSQPPVDYVVKSFLLLPQAEFPILGVGWTLVHEVYFYAVFALFMLLPRRLLPFLLTAWAAMIVAGGFAGFSVPFAGTMRELVFYPMTMEFILGAFAGLAVVSGWVWRPGVLALVAALWLAGVLSYHGVETPDTLKWGRVLWYGPPSALLIYALAGLDLKRRLAWLIPAAAGFLVALGIYQLAGLSETSPDLARQDAAVLATIVGALAMLAVLWTGWLLGYAAPGPLRATQPFFQRLMRWAVRLGDWSFSLYLSHIIVLTAVRRTFETLGTREALAPYFRLGAPGPVDNLLFLVLCLVLSIAGAWLAYRYIEKPWIILFGDLRRFLFHRRRGLASA